jgi:hypothetical protein
MNKQELKQLIKEEINNVLKESVASMAKVDIYYRYKNGKTGSLFITHANVDLEEILKEYFTDTQYLSSDTIIDSVTIEEIS